MNLNHCRQWSATLRSDSGAKFWQWARLRVHLRMFPDQVTSLLTSRLIKLVPEIYFNAGTEDPDALDPPKSPLLHHVADGGGLLNGHPSPIELDTLQPLDGSHQNLRRHVGEILEVKLKLTEPQVRRVADPGEEGGELAWCKTALANTLQLDEGPGQNFRVQGGKVDRVPVDFQSPQPGVRSGCQPRENGDSEVISEEFQFWAYAVKVNLRN